MLRGSVLIANKRGRREIMPRCNKYPNKPAAACSCRCKHSGAVSCRVDRFYSLAWVLVTGTKDNQSYLGRGTNPTLRELLN